MFDDVESFVSKLQKSAEAARVLEHRERGRRARRREAGGEGRHWAGSQITPSPGHFQITSFSLVSPLAPPARLTPHRELSGAPPLSDTVSVFPVPLPTPPAHRGPPDTAG